MKRLIATILLLTLCGYLLAQQLCGTIDSKMRRDIPSAYLFIPKSSDPIKHIRVNIHILLLEKTHPNYPCNYTKFDKALQRS